MAAVLAVANGNAGDTGSGNYRQRREEKTRETCSEQWEKFALCDEQGGNDRRPGYNWKYGIGLQRSCPRPHTIQDPDQLIRNRIP